MAFEYYNGTFLRGICSIAEMSLKDCKVTVTWTDKPKTLTWKVDWMIDSCKHIVISPFHNLCKFLQFYGIMVPYVCFLILYHTSIDGTIYTSKRMPLGEGFRT